MPAKEACAQAKFRELGRNLQANPELSGDIDSVQAIVVLIRQRRSALPTERS